MLVNLLKIKVKNNLSTDVGKANNSNNNLYLINNYIK